MKKLTRHLYAIAIAAICTGCITGESHYVLRGEKDYLADNIASIEKVDVNWAEMETIRIVCDAETLSPATIQLTKGKPYRIEIQNDDYAAHNFTSDEFFQNVTTEKLESTDGKISLSALSAVEVYPGRTMDLYFVPNKQGEYPLHSKTAGKKDIAGLIVVN